MRLVLLLLLISQSLWAGDEQGTGSNPESSTTNENTQYIQVCTQASDSDEVSCTIVAVSTNN